MGTAGVATKSGRRIVVRRYFTFLLAIFSFYVTCSIAGGIVLALMALHPQRRSITPEQLRAAKVISRQESFSLHDAELRATDGILLSAWFLDPNEATRDAVILLHGVADNRLGMSGYARLLLRNGYAVLLPDARAHGLSGGELATYGLRETLDINAWIDWIESNMHPRCVYGLGESMGAAQLLQSLGQERRFCAVVAESSFASFREVAYDRVGQPFNLGPWLGRTFFRPIIDVAFLYCRIRYGLDFEQTSPERAVANTRIPVLLVHGLEDRNIPPRHSEQIKEASPAVVLWEVPGAVHTGAYRADPHGFEHRLLDWFASHT